MTKAKEQSTENETEVVRDEVNIFDPVDQKEAARRVEQRRALREQKVKAIAFMEIPYLQSNKLLGANFDIIDAVRKSIKDEINVSFILRLNKDVDGTHKTGSKVSVSKKLNAFTVTYLDYFETFDADEVPEPMFGYTFVEIEGGTAGNKPIVLRKIENGDKL